MSKPAAATTAATTAAAASSGSSTTAAKNAPVASRFASLFGDDDDADGDLFSGGRCVCSSVSCTGGLVWDSIELILNKCC